jgi:hypothetical protein
MYIRTSSLFHTFVARFMKIITALFSYMTDHFNRTYKTFHPDKKHIWICSPLHLYIREALE